MKMDRETFDHGIRWLSYTESEIREIKRLLDVLLYTEHPLEREGACECILEILEVS